MHTKNQKKEMTAEMMIKFRKAKLLKTAPIIISTAGTGISTAGLIINKKRLDEEVDRNEKQAAAMYDLSNELKKLNRDDAAEKAEELGNVLEETSPKKPSERVKFRKKKEYDKV